VTPLARISGAVDPRGAAIRRAGTHWCRDADNADDSGVLVSIDEGAAKQVEPGGTGVKSRYPNDTSVPVSRRHF